MKKILMLLFLNVAVVYANLIEITAECKSPDESSEIRFTWTGSNEADSVKLSHIVNPLYESKVPASGFELSLENNSAKAFVYNIPFGSNTVEILNSNNVAVGEILLLKLRSPCGAIYLKIGKNNKFAILTESETATLNVKAVDASSLKTVWIELDKKSEIRNCVPGTKIFDTAFSNLVLSLGDNLCSVFAEDRQGNWKNKLVNIYRASPISVDILEAVNAVSSGEISFITSKNATFSLWNSTERVVELTFCEENKKVSVALTAHQLGELGSNCTLRVDSGSAVKVVPVLWNEKIESVMVAEQPETQEEENSVSITEKSESNQDMNIRRLKIHLVEDKKGKSRAYASFTTSPLYPQQKIVSGVISIAGVASSGEWSRVDSQLNIIKSVYKFTPDKNQPDITAVYTEIKDSADTRVIRFIFENQIQKFLLENKAGIPVELSIGEHVISKKVPVLWKESESGWIGECK